MGRVSMRVNGEWVEVKGIKVPTWQVPHILLSMPQVCASPAVIEYVGKT